MQAPWIFLVVAAGVRGFSSNGTLEEVQVSSQPLRVWGQGGNQAQEAEVRPLPRRIGEWAVRGRRSVVVGGSEKLHPGGSGGGEEIQGRSMNREEDRPEGSTGNIMPGRRMEEETGRNSHKETGREIVEETVTKKDEETGRRSDEDRGRYNSEEASGSSDEETGKSSTEETRKNSYTEMGRGRDKETGRRRDEETSGSSTGEPGEYSYREMGRGGDEETVRRRDEEIRGSRTEGTERSSNDEETGRGHMKKMKKNLKKIMPYLLVPGMMALGYAPFILASLKMFVMNAVMINMMAFNAAIFITLRNMVFGPRVGQHVKYYNFGYSHKKKHHHSL